jgi:hypothetical protein
MSGNIPISWEEAQLKIDAAEQRMGGRQATPQELLKHGPVNRRVIDAEQAKALAFLNLLHKTFTAYCENLEDAKVFDYMIHMRNDVEEYQMTIDDKQDARNEFIETKVAEATRANMGKGGANLSITTDGGSEGDS